MEERWVPWYEEKKGHAKKSQLCPVAGEKRHVPLDNQEETFPLAGSKREKRALRA